MDEISERGVYRVWFGSAFMGVALAFWAVGRVTLRWVPVEWDVPTYGFPMQSYGYTGVSSGEDFVAMVPFAVNIACAMLVTLPMSYVLLKRIGSVWSVLLGLIGLFSLAARGVLFAFWVYMGLTHVTPWVREWPVDCVTVWIGKPAARLDWTDADDVCVVRARERLESRQ